MSGGVGATSIAVNLAHELANPGKKEKPLRTLLIDMDLQFGAISSYLDLERKTSVLQLLSDMRLWMIASHRRSQKFLKTSLC